MMNQNTEISKDWNDLAEIVTDAKISLYQLIEESHAKIYMDHSFDIYCNKEQIQLVFQHLIENAIKYCEIIRNPEIIISASNRKYQWYFEISDNACGVKAQHKEDIFRPFFRLHSDESIKGSGLGLSVCKRVIEAHGGTISTRSNNKNSGSIFYFYIPKPN